jgi:hypothetical protein
MSFDTLDLDKPLRKTRVAVAAVLLGFVIAAPALTPIMESIQDFLPTVFEEIGNMSGNHFPPEYWAEEELRREQLGLDIERQQADRDYRALAGMLRGSIQNPVVVAIPSTTRELDGIDLPPPKR